MRWRHVDCRSAMTALGLRLHVCATFGKTFLRKKKKKVEAGLENQDITALRHAFKTPAATKLNGLCANAISCSSQTGVSVKTRAINSSTCKYLTVCHC